MNGSTGIDASLIFEECSELLKSLHEDMTGMRAGPPDATTRLRMQRSAHTVKGLIGFLGVERMSELAVGIEEVLRRFRDDESVTPMPDTVERLLAELNELIASLDAIGQAEEEDVPMDPEVARRLEAISQAVGEVLEGFGLCATAVADSPSATLPPETPDDVTVAANLSKENKAAVLISMSSEMADRLTEKMTAFMYDDDHSVDENEKEELIQGALGEMGNFLALSVLGKLGLAPEIGSPAYIRGKGRRLTESTATVHTIAVKVDFGEFVVGALEGAHVSGLDDQAAGGKAEAMGKVLVADDSMVMRKTIANLLERSGFSVVAYAANGQEAVEHFRHHRPDIVTMDINMPIMTGLDALRIIRAEDPGAKVLMCSAIAETGVIRRGLSSGAVGYITKPFKPETLLEAVTYLMQKKAESKPQPTAGSSAPQIDALGVYRVEKLLGEGGMAYVYKGFDPGLGREVAIKVMMDQYAADVDLVVRFLEEARAVAKVSHPNVVSIYAAGSESGRHYFAMELLPGPDLEELVYYKGPLSPEKALLYTCQGAKGLAAAAEKGLIHCDVKPSNLVFGDDGQVKVTDFGIAQNAGTEDNPTISQMVGTPCFMSPEQVMEEAIDHRADIYSLGTTLYYLLTGNPPYDGDDGVEIALRQVNDPVPQVPGAPRKVNKLIARMMAKSPDARPATYDDLIHDLERLI